MSYETLLVTYEDAVATVTLNRPAKLNAMTKLMLRELDDVFGKLDEDKAVRAIVLTGAGRAFCAGGDLRDIVLDTLELPAPDRAAFLTFADRVTLRMCRTGKPTIAAINGPAIGGGACLILSCDIRVAASEAKIAFMMTTRGVSGADMGATWLLQRIVGFGRASELLLGGDTIDAEFAERIGLVNYVVPTEQLQDYVKRMAAKLASGPPFAVRMTKRALAMSSATDLVSALDYEAMVQTYCMTTKEAQEGVNSFFERRAPSYQIE